MVYGTGNCRETIFHACAVHRFCVCIKTYFFLLQINFLITLY
uniref:Uncharacterized protein n=1 Tax=Anguilla anguilla TaxID=7936 RepID=A0A0E9PZZ4_ANGAN